MLRFLLNANISFETADFLNSLGYDAKTVAQFGLEGDKKKVFKMSSTSVFVVVEQ